MKVETKTVEVEVEKVVKTKVKQKAYMLTLTQDEAAALCQVVGSFQGYNNFTTNVLSNIFDKLHNKVQHWKYEEEVGKLTFDPT